MAFPLAATLIGSSLISGFFSNKAGKRQAAGAQAGIEAQREFIGPFAEAGISGLGAVQDFVNTGGDFSQTQDFKDIANLAKAGRGAGFGSGNLLTSLIDFQQTNFRPQRLDELLALPRLGVGAATGAASNIANLEQNAATARARGDIGIGTAATSGLNSLAFLSLLNRPSGG